MASETFQIRESYGKLREDGFRKSNPFSPEIELVNRVLFHTHTGPSHKQQAISDWLQGKGNQPCVFGAIAAAKATLHYCIISDQDLQRSDQFIEARIKHELLKWKRRSVRPTAEFSRPAHGFILVVASEHVATAAPDDRLKEFAQTFLRVWGCPSSRSQVGDVYTETLYLQEYPKQEYRRFTFSVDFFAAQGDRRWWHDHRFPGGITFTANSVGHMRWYKEWYQNSKKQIEWSLRTAMQTIDSASDVGYGPATWLKTLADGLPVQRNLANPLEPDVFLGKDWTRYGGRLHTDLAVREEFFHETPEPSEEVLRRAFNQDFAYLYDPGNPDYARFVMGERAEFSEIAETIGDPADYTEVETPKIQAAEPTGETDVEELLQQCRRWRLTALELEKLNS